MKVRERQPEDLDAALRIASQLEVLEADTVRLKEGSRLEREGKRVREISNKKPNGETHQKKLEEKMEEKMEASLLNSREESQQLREMEDIEAIFGSLAQAGIPHRIRIMGHSRREMAASR